MAHERARDDGEDEDVLYGELDAREGARVAEAASAGAIGRFNLKLGESEARRRALMDENASLRERCENLERNISGVCNAARGEIERKDKEIARLREGDSQLCDARARFKS